jgi:hypothetical protein
MTISCSLASRFTWLGFLAVCLMQRIPLSAQTQSSNDNIVLQMPLNEGNGDPADLADPSAVIDNVGTAWSADAHEGSASLQFKGGSPGPSNVRVDSKKIDLDGKTKLTVEAWVKQTDRTGVQYVAAQENEGGFNLGLADGCVWFMLRTEDEKWNGIWKGEAGDPISRIPLNKWTHIAGVYDGSTIKVYVDGQQRISKELDGGGIESAGTFVYISSKQVLAQNPNGQQMAFRGNIQDVQVSTVAKSF